VGIVTVNSLDTIAANVKDAVTEPTIHNDPPDRAAPRRLATVLDAKRGQFYTAVYEWTASDADPQGCEAPSDAAGYRISAARGGFWRKILDDCLMSASEFASRFGAGREPMDLVGDGLLYHRDAFACAGVRILDEAYWSPRAAQVHSLGYQKCKRGLYADPLDLTPLYLRGPQVTLRKAP
jgi:tRNA A37 threonylcarbamoyladenosine modification protein TsaB